ncbi:carcinoembryonic antigen-related cell adhesion molecule 3-like isoform X2 [Dendropsophus ebraccatus]|uniref:carcinoembryonic antigen-related cell adhesion molecule 3-like isoform X2 n=1 Tax=Dendropsophus ebraccatus TaxID=150705 RepID=UPI003831012F
MRVGLLLVLVASWMSSALGISIEIYPPNPTVNQTVILNVLGIAGTVRYIEWYTGPDTNATNQIIRINEAGRITTGNKFFPEASLFPNGSLQISNAQRSRAGYYTVSVQAEKLLQETVLLTLSEPRTDKPLSSLAIAGIVIGVLVGIGLLIGVSLCLYKKCCASGVI